MMPAFNMCPCTHSLGLMSLNRGVLHTCLRQLLSTTQRFANLDDIRDTCEHQASELYSTQLGNKGFVYVLNSCFLWYFEANTIQ